MSYCFTATIKDKTFDEVIDTVTEELKKEGFGVLTDIDIKATFKKKLDVDFKKYRILGACNPTFAHKAISMEDKIGVFLPCNVIVEEDDYGHGEVSAVDPVASMVEVDNENLVDVANEIRQKLMNVIDNL